MVVGTVYGCGVYVWWFGGVGGRGSVGKRSSGGRLVWCFLVSGSGGCGDSVWLRRVCKVVGGRAGNG